MSQIGEPWLRRSPFALPEQEARNLAQALDYRVGAVALIMEGGNASPGRVVTGYEVQPFPGIPGGWGVVERWRYGDMPDSPPQGSGFLPAHAMTMLAGRAPRCHSCRRLLTAVERLRAPASCLSCMSEPEDQSRG